MIDEIIKELKEALAALKVENEALRAEVERLSRYYKNGIDCFANPCERHSGERTPPFAEFFEKYGGQCLICVVDNNKALRAKIEALERQEPVAWLHETRRDSDVVTNAVKHVWGKAVVGALAEYSIPLYLAPGAQPAPIIPEGWKPIPEKHPTFDPVDLRLADGSVLCGCVPQSDGDYWWNGPSGEVFIDPRYAPVTHWRLAAAPEDKP